MFALLLSLCQVKAFSGSAQETGREHSKESWSQLTQGYPKPYGIMLNSNTKGKVGEAICTSCHPGCYGSVLLWLTPSDTGYLHQCWSICFRKLQVLTWRNTCPSHWTVVSAKDWGLLHFSNFFVSGLILSKDILSCWASFFKSWLIAVSLGYCT